MGSKGKRSDLFGKRRIKIPPKEGIALLARRKEIHLILYGVARGVLAIASSV